MADDPQLEQDLAALLEREWFEPPADFRANALISDMSVHEEARRDPVGWWERQAESLDWFERWEQPLDDSESRRLVLLPQMSALDWDALMVSPAYMRALDLVP